MRMRRTIVLLLALLVAPVHAQNTNTYLVGVFKPGVTAPSSGDVPLATVSLSVASGNLACGVVGAGTAPTPVLVCPSCGAIKFAVDDPASTTTPPAACVSTDQQPTLSATNGLPACSAAPCPQYPAFVQATNSAGKSAWSAAMPELFQRQPPPAVPTNPRVTP